MKEFVFEINGNMEKVLTGLLNQTGINTFYFETYKRKNFLKLYLENDNPPEFLIKEKLVSSSDVDSSSLTRVWCDSYKGQELTDNIYVLPSGIEPPLKQYNTIIEIDPYDSFGDGHHPTTILCGRLLEYVLASQIERFDTHKLSLLDVGTGSGVLAIAAWKMGIRIIDLFDYDPVSVEKADKNLKLNGIYSLKPFQADIYKYTSEKKYDIITANLLSRLIEDNISRLINLIIPEGKIILSGISTKWTNEMMNLFLNNRLEIIKHEIIDEWNGFILKKSKHFFISYF
jgi:ribosomal protein L11 methyltransferase